MIRTSPLRRFTGLIAGICAVAVAAHLSPTQVLALDCGEPDDMEKATNYSLYYESFKNKDYKAAMPYLRWMLDCAPTYAGPGRVSDRNIKRAIEAYEQIGLQAEDPDMQRAYLDTALAWFDKAVPTLEEAGVEVERDDRFAWTLNKGRFLQEHAALLPDMEGEAYSLYREAFEFAPDLMSPYYMQLVVYDYVRQGDKAGAVEIMEDIEQRQGDNEELMAYLSQVRNSLFTSPEERMSFLEGQLENKPGDAEIIAELFEIYMELDYREEMFAMGDSLLSVDPTARTYQLLAKARLDDGLAEEAMELYEQALALEGSDQYARDIYYNMGVAQQQLENLSSARRYFREALSVDSNFADALLAIGDVYVSAVSSCGGSEMAREDQAVYWLATDYYERAKSVDAASANQANRKIRNIRPYFPNQEALFFKGWTAGDQYRIDYGCYSWISETTRVRPPN